VEFGADQQQVLTHIKMLHDGASIVLDARTEVYYHSLIYRIVWEFTQHSNIERLVEEKSQEERDTLYTRVIHFLEWAFQDITKHTFLLYKGDSLMKRLILLPPASPFISFWGEWMLFWKSCDAKFLEEKVI
jgi:hypothetical protein